MNKQHLLIVMSLAVSMLTESVAFAHDASLHKGKPTMGEIISVEGKDLKLRTVSGVKTVTVTDDTKVELDDKPGESQELKVGDHLAVFGTTLASGELVAKEIVRESDSNQEHSEPHTHPHS